MPIDTMIKKRIRKLKGIYPGMDEKQLERELLPLSGEEVRPKILKKKVKQ